MCLYIEQVPTSKNSCFVLEGIKLLYPVNSNFFTIVRHLKVPDHGWLFPNRTTKRKNYLDMQEVAGGHIHYYTKNALRTGWAMILPTRDNTFTCYAIDTKAFGGCEAVCLALYIPKVDKTGAKIEILKLLNKAR